MNAPLASYLVVSLLLLLLGPFIVSFVVAVFGGSFTGRFGLWGLIWRSFLGTFLFLLVTLAVLWGLAFAVPLVSDLFA